MLWNLFQKKKRYWPQKSELNMEETLRQPNAEDIDEDAKCRLRYGLNTHCLTEIFQYLDSIDLNTVGDMNGFYKQIIADFVIPKHKIDFDLLHSKSITDQQLFKKYGTKMRMFKISCKNDESFQQFIQLITQYCSHDQLKKVSFVMSHGVTDDINLPVHFQRVESFHFSGVSNYSPILSLSFSDSLQHLYLRNLSLHADFSWIEMVNLKKLVVEFVKGFNEQNFIQLLHQGTRLEYFHQVFTLFNPFSEVRDAIAKYCGQQIRTLVDNCLIKRPNDCYNFLSKFKKLNEVWLSSQQKCVEDLKYPLKLLAENDTIEKLGIICSTSPVFPHSSCGFQQEFIHQHQNWHMKPFTKLKTICFIWINCGSCNYNVGCNELKLLTQYSTQTLSNVENLILRGSGARAVYKTELLKFIPKLCWLHIDYWTEPTYDQAVKLVGDLNRIVCNRNNGYISNDFIEVEVLERDLKVYEGIVGIGNSVRINVIGTNLEKGKL